MSTTATFHAFIGLSKGPKLKLIPYLHEYNQHSSLC
jgi:hypothetical protein